MLSYDIDRSLTKDEQPLSRGRIESDLPRVKAFTLYCDTEWTGWFGFL